MKKIFYFIFLVIAACSLACAKTVTKTSAHETAKVEIVDTIEVDSTILTEADFERAAEELGVEPATIHAVVEIEAGTAHQGFWSPGKPIINFTLSLFRTYARKHGVNLAQYMRSHPVVFSGASRSRYGSQQAAVQARVDAALEIDEAAAIEATFWGMFQIGGFNWKKLGFSSPQEFLEKMSRSEQDQLDIFVRFIKETGLQSKLQRKDWAGFARIYNGPSYASRGYHTKLARAYAKYSKRAAANKQAAAND